MGNHNSSHHAGKLVFSDGSILEFRDPITVAELMIEHPQQVVVEFNYKPSSNLDKVTKPTPLPADKKLEVNKIYLMLPLRRGKLPSFSPKDANQILVRVNAILRAQSFFPSSSSSRTLRFFGKIRPLNAADKCHTLVVPRKDFEEEDEDFDNGKKDYFSRQVSGKAWKPSLDTIKENREGKKDLNLVLLATKVGKRIENKGLVWG